MSKDLEEFAKYFTGTLNMGLGHLDKYYDRQERAAALRHKETYDASREARETRKTDQWVKQSDAYMNYLNRKGAGGGGAGKAPAGSSQFNQIMASRGISPAPAPPQSTVTLQQPDTLASPPGPPSEGEPMATGGTVRRPYVGGTTGPGSGYGTIAAPPGMRRGGRVRRFADGGMMSLGEASQGGPGGKKSSTNAAGAATAAINTSDSAMGRAAGRLGRWAATRKSTPDVGSYGQGGGGMDGSEDRFRDGGTVRRFAGGGSADDARLLQGKTGAPTTDFRMGDGRAMVGGMYNPTDKTVQAEAGYEHPVGRNTTLGIQGDFNKYVGPGGDQSKPDWGVGVRGRIKFRDGGTVRRFAGGGLFPATSPEERAEIEREAAERDAARAERRRQLGVDPVPSSSMSPFPPVSPEARDRAVRSSGEQISVPERDVNLLPPTSDAGRQRMVDQAAEDRQATEDRRAIRAGQSDDEAGFRPGPLPTPLDNDAGFRPGPLPSPPLDNDAGFRPGPLPKRAGGGGGGGGGGGRSGGGNEPWKKLGDQTRDKAYDPEKDYADPRNIHAVDRWGRSRSAGAASAGAEDGARPSVRTAEGGDGLNPQGSSGQGAGQSTNNVASDLAASRGASNFAEHTFHLGNADKNSASGYEALASGHGAPTIGTIEKMRMAVDPDGRLPPNELMRQLRNKSYEFYMQKGDQARADKAAFEVSQFGNVMAKSHGTNAQKLLAKGDIEGATHEVAAGYNWLPNGHTVNIDPSGKMAVIEGPDGKVVQQVPITPQVLKQVSDGMTHGVFNWDVMNGGGALPAAALSENAAPAGPGGGAPGQAIATGVPAAPGGAPPGAPSPPAPGGLPPTVRPPPAQSGAQPSPAAPAGPVPPQAAGPETGVNPTKPPALTPGQTPAPPPAPVPPKPSAPPAPASPPTAPAAPPTAPTTPAPNTREDALQQKQAQRQKEREESLKALEKGYTENPDQVPGPQDVPVIRRGSLDQERIDPKTWEYLHEDAKADYEHKVADMYAVAAQTRDAKPADIAHALQQFESKYKEQQALIESRRKEHVQSEQKLNEMEERRVKQREVKTENVESNTNKLFNDYFEKAYQKYKTYDPEKEGAKARPEQDYALVSQAPLRYMQTAASREKLGDVARRIWENNPGMSEREAANHALTFTSFVSKKGKDMNGNSGEKGRTYRAIGVDPLGNVVLRNEAHENVHVNRDTLQLIQNLRANNFARFEKEMKKLNEDREHGVGTERILRGAVEGAAKMPLTDPITAGVGIAGRVAKKLGGGNQPDEGDE